MYRISQTKNIDKISAKRNGNFPASKKFALGLLSTVLFTAMWGKPALSQSPMTNSPTIPTSYSWLNFHAGGVQQGVTVDLTNLPLAPWEQLQGTPNWFVPTNVTGSQAVSTEIPSFILGNYDPNSPPDANGPAPKNHFRDGEILSWASPLPWTVPGDKYGLPLAVDDSDGPGIFDSTGTWQASDTLKSDGTVASTGDFPANVKEESLSYKFNYRRARIKGILNSTEAPSATATWTLTVPTNGWYKFSFHIPPNSDATEARISDAHYVVNVARNGKTYTLADTRISQQSASDQQYITGPFYLLKGETPTVTLDNTTFNTGVSSTTYIIADSVTLNASSGGDIKGSPVAINYDHRFDVNNTPTSGYDFTNKYLSSLTFGQIGKSNLDPTKVIPATEMALSKYYTVKSYKNMIDNVNNVFEPDDTQHAGLPDPNTQSPYTVHQLVYYGRTECVQNLGDIDPTHMHRVGAVYCVDGFNGAVIWRYQCYDRNAANTAYIDNAIESSPVVTRLRVLTDPINNTYDTKLVVIVADNRGWIHCIDAIGNGDGTKIDATTGFPAQIGTTKAYWVYRPGATSSNQSLDDDPAITNSSQLTYVDAATPDHTWVHNVLPTLPNSSSALNGSYSRIPIEAAETTPGTVTYTFPVYINGTYSLMAHIPGKIDTDEYRVTDASYQVTINDGGPGTSTVYQVDQTQLDRIINITGANTTFTISNATINTPSTVTVQITNENATATSGHTYYVVTDSISIVSDGKTNMPLPDAFGLSSPTIYIDPSPMWTDPTAVPAQSLYIGNTNGTLYAFDPTGIPAGQDPYLTTIAIPKQNGIDVPTIMPKWWFNVRGSKVDSKPAAIESAPAIYVPDPSKPAIHYVIFGSAHEQSTSTGMGRIYAVKNDGPLDQTGTATLQVGTLNYNINSRPFWSFPHAYTDGGVNNSPVSPALGDISGSPVVFKNPNTGVTRIYFAAGTGLEIPFKSTTAQRADPGTTGRLWCVDTTPDSNGEVFKWAFPSAHNPNDSTLSAELTIPIGSFSHATPAIGVVQFPGSIFYGAGKATEYKHADIINTDIKAKSVPMLYIGCNGDPDTGLYALDLNGGDTSVGTDNIAHIDANSVVADKQRFIYRRVSPDGFGYTSSPVLIVNSSSSPATYGNGGSVFVTAGDSVYQFTATPTTNTNTSQNFPMVGLQSRIIGFGPFSSPAFAAANVIDLTTDHSVELVRDWLYCGDSNSGFLRGITSHDTASGSNDTIGDYIQQNYIPPSGPTPPRVVTTKFCLHAYIISKGKSETSTDLTDFHKMDGSVTEDFFDWGDKVNIRFTNVVPPNINGASLADKPELFVQDPDYHNLYYTAGSPITYTIQRTDNLESSSSGGGSPILFTGSTIGADGFYIRTGTNGYPGDDGTEDDRYRVRGGSDPNKKSYLYATTYYLGLSDTPGTHRQIISASQIARVYDANSNTYLTNPVTITMESGETGAPSTPKPTLGISNPLSVMGLSDIHIIGSLGDVTCTNPGIDNVVKEYASNGNLILDTLPPAGIPERDQTAYNQDSTGSNVNYNNTGKIVYVYTTVGCVPDGKIGYNNYGGLLVGDRSKSGARGMSIAVRMEQQDGTWYDPSPSHGPGARINPLPWEDYPLSNDIGANTSLDYPDIKGNNYLYMLYTDPTGTGNGGLLVANGSQAPKTILDPYNVTQDKYYRDNVIANVNIPIHQPANLSQTPVDSYTSSTSGITPYSIPYGYVAKTRIFVDADNNGICDTTKEAYRDIYVTASVPINMSTRIAEPSVNIGTIQSGFGTYMSDYIAAQGQTQTDFSPYTPYYQQFFKPLTIYNSGNVNLLNVHLNQKLIWSYGASTSQPGPLQLTTSTIDPSSYIPAYDFDKKQFLLRSSLDWDLIELYGLNKGLAALDANSHPLSSTYKGATFHKARPGDSDAKLTVPDYTPNTSSSYNLTYTSGNPTTENTKAFKPYISVAVPYGTPVGEYSQVVRLFEGIDYDVNNALSSIVQPTYGGKFGGIETGDPPFDRNDVFWIRNDIMNPGIFVPSGGTQPFSNPGTVVHIKVTENHLSNDLATQSNGILNQIPTFTPSSDKTAAYNPSTDVTPVAVRNAYYNAGGVKYNGANPGSVSILWASSRNTTMQQNYSLWSALLSTDTKGNFVPYSDSGSHLLDSWWYPNNLSASLSSGSYYAPAIAQDQELYNPSTATSGGANDTFSSDGNTYAFYVKYDPAVTTTSPFTLNCASLDPSSGTLGTSAVVASSTQGMYNVSGLKYHPTGIYAVNDPVTTSTAIKNNLWAFWNNASGGDSKIFYSSIDTTDSNASFENPNPLPIAAGLSSVASASATLIMAPDMNISTAPTVPMIQVTYSGINYLGNSDVYVSRYRQYVYTDPATAKTSIRLMPVAFKPMYEELTPDNPQNPYWWSARDAGWSRWITPVIHVYNVTQKTHSHTDPNDKNISFDIPSQTLILPNQVLNGVSTSIYIDLAKGRVRFSKSITGGSDQLVVFIEAAPLARRLATDTRSDVSPVAFIDAALKSNEATAYYDTTYTTNVQAARCWTFWRKSGGGSSQSPAIYYNTQRLTIFLHDASGKSVGIKVDPTGTDASGNALHKVQLTSVTDVTTGKVITNIVDIDPARGRIYLPLLVPSDSGFVSPEGHKIEVKFTDSNGVDETVYDYVMWMDEPETNTPQDNNSAPIIIPGINQAILPRVAANEVMAPCSNPVNEGMPYAFLDPFAYANLSNTLLTSLQPHKVWLFWTSTRNTSINLLKSAPDWDNTTIYHVGDMAKVGNVVYDSIVDNNSGHQPANTDYWRPHPTSDIYFELLNPRFSAVPVTSINQ